MTKDEILYIFRTFWPENGYEGIHPYLPGWSRSRDGAFASRNGIRMNEEDKKKPMKQKPITPTRSTENRFLMGKW